MTSTDLKTLENAIENLSSEQKKLIVEKEEIKELKDELKDYEEVCNISFYFVLFEIKMCN